MRLHLLKYFSTPSVGITATANGHATPHKEYLHQCTFSDIKIIFTRPAVRTRSSNCISYTSVIRVDDFYRHALWLNFNFVFNTYFVEILRK